MKYLPQFVLERYRAGELQGRFRCTALFVDIAGFTALTEKAFALGEQGAELMGRLLRQVFDPPVNAVVGRAGIIAGFAGDAFTALFPDDDGARAHSAAAEIARFFAEHGRQETPQGVFDFNARCGIDSGEVSWGIAKDSLGRCTWYFRGAPIGGAAAAQQKAPPGGIALTERIDPGIPARPPAPASLPESPAADPPEVLAAFVQREVRGAGDRPEIKPVTPVFLSFARASSGELRPGAEKHDEIERLLSAVRDEAISCRGTFNKLDFGDKGMTMLCLFGAPRGVDRPAVAALEFLQRLRARLRSELPEVRTRAGVDSGLVYCGPTGGELRNEWTCLGDAVNTSARLMDRARWDETVVSLPVKEGAGQHFDFFPLGRHKLKGKTGLQVLFACRRRSAQATGRAYEQRMQGREAELEGLLGRVRALHERPGFGGMVYVFGEAGMGKTRLVQELRRRLEESELAYHWVQLPCLENDGGLRPLGVWLERLFEVNVFMAEVPGGGVQAERGPPGDRAGREAAGRLRGRPTARQMTREER